jgi:hypothetical protein
MGWTTPPTFSSGGIASSAYLNDISQDLVVLQGALSALGDTTPTHFLYSSVGGGTTDGSGNLAYTYPSAFILAFNGKGSGSYTITINHSSGTSTTGFTMIWYTSSTGAALATTAVNAYYIAFGH